jgi:myo-inositol-1(or 4)-monophosphatase
MINFIQTLVKQAGELLLSYFGKDEDLLALRASVKESVTKYDKLIDSRIVQEIRRRYPDHSILTEESGLLEGSPDWLWIVDSLDGTSDFAASNPLFSVCVAVAHKGELILGAVYAPAIGEF